jgi:hypothetical protein
MEQNINMVHKINEANHTYRDMRMKASKRINKRASLYEIERRRQELEIQKSLGVESYFGDNETLLWGVITAVFYAVLAYYLWVSL